MRQGGCQVKHKDQTRRWHEWYSFSSPCLLRWDGEERYAPLTRDVSLHRFRYFWPKSCRRMRKSKEWIDASTPTIDVGKMGIFSWLYINLDAHRKLYSGDAIIFIPTVKLNPSTYHIHQTVIRRQFSVNRNSKQPYTTNLETHPSPLPIPWVFQVSLWIFLFLPISGFEYKQMEALEKNKKEMLCGF